MVEAFVGGALKGLGAFIFGLMLVAVVRLFSRSAAVDLEQALNLPAMGKDQAASEPHPLAEPGAPELPTAVPGAPDADLLTDSDLSHGEPPHNEREAPLTSDKRETGRDTVRGHKAPAVLAEPHAGGVASPSNGGGVFLIVATLAAIACIVFLISMTNDYSGSPSARVAESQVNGGLGQNNDTTATEVRSNNNVSASIDAAALPPAVDVSDWLLVLRTTEGGTVHLNQRTFARHNDLADVWLQVRYGHAQAWRVEDGINGRVVRFDVERMHYRFNCADETFVIVERQIMGADEEVVAHNEPEQIYRATPLSGVARQILPLACGVAPASTASVSNARSGVGLNEGDCIDISLREGMGAGERCRAQIAGRPQAGLNEGDCIDISLREGMGAGERCRAQIAGRPQAGLNEGDCIDISLRDGMGAGERCRAQVRAAAGRQ